MPKVEKWIIGRRCDESMKRSKEKCITPLYTRWKCNNDCKTCICCIYKINDGTEHHFDPNSRGTANER